MKGISVSANQITAQAGDKLLFLVYADEPTASLDAANRQLVTDLLLYVTSLLLPLQPGYRKDAISLLYTLVYGKLLSKKSKSEVKRTIGRKG